jgi:hypothetical protein
VRQLVQQSFMFRIQRPVDSVPPNTSQTDPPESPIPDGVSSWLALT